MNPWDIEEHLNDGAEQAIAMGLVSPDEAQSRVQSALAMPAVLNLKGQKESNQNNMRWQRNTNAKVLPSYDELHAQMLMAQGIRPGIKLNEQGQEQYAQATNNLGQPIYSLPSGETTLEKLPGVQPIYDKNQPIYDWARNAPDPEHPMQQQKRGIDEMQNLLAMQGGALSKQGVGGAIDLSPLAALADYENQKQGLNSNLLKGYRPPAGPEAVRDKLFAYQQQIQKDREDWNKQITQNFNAQNKSGGTLADFLAMTQGKTSQTSEQDALAGGSGAALRAQSMEDRQVRMLHDKMLRDAVEDKKLGQYLTQFGTLNNAISNLANADHLDPASFDEAQQAVRSQLGIKGTSGVGEREKTQLNSLGYNVDRLLRLATGKPADISQNDPLVQHIKQLAALEQNNVTDQFQKRLGPILSRNKWIYENPRYEYLKNDLSPFSASIMGQIQSTPLMREAISKGNAYNPKTPTKAPRAADAVDVIAPDGTEGTIPKGNLQKALKAGYKLKGK